LIVFVALLVGCSTSREEADFQMVQEIARAYSEVAWAIRSETEVVSEESVLSRLSAKGFEKARRARDEKALYIAPLTGGEFRHSKHTTVTVKLVRNGYLVLGLANGSAEIVPRKEHVPDSPARDTRILKSE
jgi:hypothetical protein